MAAEETGRVAPAHGGPRGGQPGATNMAVVVSVTKVATGPMTEEEAAGIARFGDLTGYAAAIQKLAAS